MAIAHRIWRPVVAIASGLALACAFPPIGLWFLAPLSVAGLTLVTVTSRLRGAVGWSLVAGLAFFLILLRWISLLGSDAWIGLSIYCAVWIALLGCGAWTVRRLPGWPVWIACIWILEEALRNRYPWGGFGWGRLAFSQAYAPDGRYASIGGAPLVSFLVALTGALIAWGILKMVRDGRAQLVRAGAAWMCACVIMFGGFLIPLATAGESDGGPPTATVAVVQGSVPATGLNDMTQRRAVLDNHVVATIRLAARVKAGEVAQPEAVIWPENSSDLDPYTNPDADQLISNAANAIGVPILVGVVRFDPTNPTQLWNAGVVWDPKTGPGDYYVKRHPVPFGEFLPGRSILTRWISRFERIPYDFSAGQTPGILQVGPVTLGDLICFEVSDDVVVRDATIGGGRALSVQTNNATFTFRGLGGSAQPEQQAAMSALRAIEHSRTVLIAATSGVSAIIGPDGKTVAEAPLFAQDELVAQVPLRSSLTMADRFGQWPEWVIGVLGGLAIVAGLVTSATRRRSLQQRPE